MAKSASKTEKWGGECPPKMPLGVHGLGCSTGDAALSRGTVPARPDRLSPVLLAIVAFVGVVYLEAWLA